MRTRRSRVLGCCLSMMMALMCVTTTTAQTVDVRDGWLITQRTSPIDDSKGITALRFSTRSQGEWRSPAALRLQCWERKMLVGIETGGQFLSSHHSWGLVTTRFDTKAAVTSSWTVSTDNKALLISGSRAQAFLMAVGSARALTMRVTPFNRSPVIYPFDVSGLGGSIKKIVELCPDRSPAATRQGYGDWYAEKRRALENALSVARLKSGTRPGEEQRILAEIADLSSLWAAAQAN